MSKSNQNENQYHDLQNAFNQFDNNRYLYQDKDINFIGEQILKELNIPLESFSHAVGQGHGILNVNEELQRKKQLMDAKKINKFFGIYGTGNNNNGHWIAFMIRPNNESYEVYIKDSLGSSTSASNLSNNIKGIFNIDDDSINVHPGEEQKNVVDCGVFALENMKKLAENTENLNPNNFQSMNFLELNETVQKRVEFSSKYILGAYKSIYGGRLSEKNEQAMRAHIKPQLQPEINWIVSKLQGVNFVEIISISPSESFDRSQESNKIAIETGVIIENPSSYQYRICLSSNLFNKRGEELRKHILEKLGLQGHNDLVFNQDGIMTIPHDLVNYGNKAELNFDYNKEESLDEEEILQDFLSSGFLHLEQMNNGQIPKTIQILGTGVGLAENLCIFKTIEVLNNIVTIRNTLTQIFEELKLTANDFQHLGYMLGLENIIQKNPDIFVRHQNIIQTMNFPYDLYDEGVYQSAVENFLEQEYHANQSLTQSVNKKETFTFDNSESEVIGTKLLTQKTNIKKHPQDKTIKIQSGDKMESGTLLDETNFKKLIQNKEETKFFVITSRNGTGKTSFLDKLDKDFNYYIKDTQVIYIKSSISIGQRIQTDDHPSHMYNLKPEMFLQASSKDIRLPDVDKKGSLDEFLSKLDRPIRCLSSILSYYLEKMRRSHDYLKPEDFYGIYKCYKEKLQLENKDDLDLESFGEKVSSESEFRNEVYIEYAIAKSKIKEVEKQLNSSLDEVQYKYRIKFNPKNLHDSSIVFLSSTSEPIPVDKVALSSGEETILGFITLQLLFRSHGFADSINSGKLLILDEPDRHLDPELCRKFMTIVSDIFPSLGIKVVMTTHRLDTISLAPDGSIFNITQNKNQYLLKNIHKIEALANLAINLHHFTNFGVKVYVEALDDKFFYERMYTHLLKHSKSIKDKIEAIKKYILKNDENEEIYKKITNLSEEYQMHFYGAGGKLNRGGGCTRVKQLVEHSNDYPQIHIPSNNHYLDINSPLFNLFRAYGIDKPFGIIDMDDPVKSDEICKGNDHMLAIKRYSLENFTCDPILICSLDNDNELLTQQHLDIIFKYPKDNFKEYKASYLERIVDTAIELYRNKIYIDRRPDRKDKVDIYIMASAADQKNKKDNSKEAKILEAARNEKQIELLKQGLYEELRGSQLNAEVNKQVTIKLTFDDEANNDIKYTYTLHIASKIINDLINLENKVAEIEEVLIKILDKDHSIIERSYPSWFFKARGHDIHDLFKFCFKGIYENFHKNLFDKLYKVAVNTEQFIPIPIDLIDVFAACNKKILEQVYDVIRPGEEIPSWWEQTTRNDDLTDVLLPLSDDHGLMEDFLSPTSTLSPGEGLESTGVESPMHDHDCHC